MKYMFLCNNCNNKVFSDGKDLSNFNEVPTAPIQQKIDDKKEKFLQQKKKIKCPKCGYIFQIVKLTQDTPKEEKNASENKDK